MFKKIFQKFEVKALSSGHHRNSLQSPAAVLPYLDIDEDDREDDGFLLIGETRSERSTCPSLENTLDLPPSYESVKDLPLYSDLFPKKMGNRNNKQEIFEPTLHAASRQSSQDAPTQNDILKPYFESLQNDRQKGNEEIRAESSVLCAAAAPPPPPSQEGKKSEAGFQTLPMVATPYEDIPFRLTAGLVPASEGGTAFTAVSDGIKKSGQSLQYRYTYDFNLEQSVLRDSQ